MPFGDGTGPLGQGSGQGRGRGMGRGQGRRRGPLGTAGPGGFCVCPSCGEKILHSAGMPCGSLDCPKCGSRMVRE